VEGVEVVGVRGWFVESKCHESGDVSHITLSRVPTSRRLEATPILMPSQRSSGKASRQANRVAITGMSKRVHTTTAERGPSGRTIVVRSSLTATKIRAVKEREAQREADRARSKILPLYYYFISLTEIPA
jgi:hypothetical protein